MAELSNQLMAMTVLAYLAAMIGYAAEYAFGNRSHVGRAAARPAKQLVGVGASVPPAAEAPVVEERAPLDRGAWAEEKYVIPSSGPEQDPEDEDREH